MSFSFSPYVFVHLLMFVTFAISGIVVNVIQFLTYLVLVTCLNNLTLFRKVNYYFVYCIYGQIAFLTDWWSRSKIRLYADPQFLGQVGRGHALIVMNHHYELDWLFGWMVADRYGVLGNARVYLKKTLKYVPIMGPAWTFGEVIYLDRNWDKDRETIASGIKALADFPDPMFLLIFAEGTRFNQEKYRASVEFAKKKGDLPILKHHLVPRSKGFVETIRNLDSNKVKVLYDVTVVANETEASPATLASIFSQKSIIGEMYVRQYETKDLVSKSDEELTKFLMDLYKEKDELKDNYLNYGSFTNHGKDKRFEDYPRNEIPARFWNLAVTVVLNCIIGYPIIKTLVSMVVWGSWTQCVCALSLVGVLFVGLSKMIGLTKISKATQYGLATKKDS